MNPKLPTLLSLALAGSLGMAACGDGGASAEAAPEMDHSAPAAAAAESLPYTDVDVAQLRQMMESKDFVLVNVHIPFEGDLPETDVSIPFDQIADHLDQLPADKDAKIVLYCRSGRMSEEAAHTLAGLGYTNLYNLAGGFIAWGDAGLPVEGI